MKKCLILSLICLVATSCGSNVKLSSSSKASSLSSLVSNTTSTSTTSSLTSSSIISASSSEISSSIQKPVAMYWSEEDEELMKKFLGFTLPYPSYTTPYNLKIEKLNENEECLCISAENEVISVYEDYIDILELNGYTPLKVEADNYRKFTYEHDGGVYLIQAGYYPKTSLTPASFEIVALFESGLKGGVNYGKSDAYPKEEVDAWLANSNIEVTIPSFSSSYYEYEYTSKSFNIIANDKGTVGFDSLEEDYLAALRKLNWEIDDSDYERNGYYAISPCGQIGSIFYSDNGKFYLELAILVSDDSGETYPQEIMDSWLASHNLTTYIPSFSSDFYLWEVSDEAVIIFANDYGIVGENSLEDSYKAELEAINWYVDDSEYADIGYVAYSPDSKIVSQFHSYDGTFYIVHALNIAGEGELIRYASYPQELVDEFLTLKNLTCPLPQFEDKTGKGYYAGIQDYSDVGEALVIQAFDEGINGVDSIEDTFKLSLEELGWIIDDSKYDEEGYYASYPNSNAKVLFFSWKGIFMMGLYLE